MRDGDNGVSVQEELTGWLAFVLFVLAVWRLRERLNRTNGDG